MPKEPSFFENLNYDDFRRLALDDSLSVYEKVGFPDSYRLAHEKNIHADLKHKAPALDAPETRILDIGCGCSDLPRMLMRTAEEKRQQLFLLDSPEMLAQLPAAPCESVVQVPARFPDCPDFLKEFQGRFDVVLTYSVIQYVFAGGNVFEFLDEALELLAPGGRLLIGDIPNTSMRKRFFASETGAAHHRAFTQSDARPDVRFNRLEAGQIDDSVVFAIVARARAAGFHGFVLPQPSELPMANRREDILVVRP
ncbi:MAG: class I SAM-dependent methyltransferase [Janthinobacterium lividum]